MKFYVANCTQQIQDFTYRLPETNSIRAQRIEIGGQIALSGDLGTLDIEAVIQQHQKYGLVNMVEIDRTKPFIGLCYSVDKPVPIDKIVNAMVHNVEVLKDRGRAHRQEAAIVINNTIEEQTPSLKSLEVSIVEEQSKNGASPEFAEGVRISRYDTPTSQPQPPRGKGFTARQTRRAG